MLYMIGVGLADEKDISVKGLEAIKSCDHVFLECYTSKLQVDVDKLSRLYGKKVIPVNREFVEDGSEIIEKAKDNNVAFLVVGDVFSATTHMALFKFAKEEKVEVRVINNASVLNAVGITGLELYKFGRTASIPFHNEGVEAPYKVFEGNNVLGLHTLFLLDLDPFEDKFMTINEAIDYLLGFDGFKEKTLCVGCARLGSENFVVKKGSAEELRSFDFGEPPYCLIVPGKLHFFEEESLELWK